jgi:hypothetical protein
MKRMSAKKEQDLIEQIKDYVESWSQYWAENNKNHEEMTKFVNGEQWKSEVKRSYTREKKPMVTMNKIRPIVQQMIGEYNLNTAQIMLRKIGLKEGEDDQKMEASVFNALNPANKQQGQGNGQPQQVSNIAQLVKVNPITPEDPKLKAAEGLVRKICTGKNVQQSYIRAGEDALKGGFGAWRVVNCYEDDKEIFQNLKIEQIIDPKMCFWDPSAKEKSKTDGEVCGIVTVMSRKKFKRDYPDAKDVDFMMLDNRSMFFWGDKDFIAIGECYKKEYYNDEEAILNDGQIVYKSDFNDADEFEREIKENVKQRYTFKNCKIMHYKFTGVEILEYSKTPFKELPILFVEGSSYFAESMQKTLSYAQDVVDAQEQLNIIASEIAVWLLIAKKAQHMAPVEVVDDKLGQTWNQAGNPAFLLPYNGSEAAKLGGLKPEIIVTPPIPTDLLTQYQRLQNDILEGLGRYQSNFGADGDEKSGIAIARRAIEGGKAFDVYRENLRNAIETTGRIILSAIPSVYDEERVISIMNRDGSDEEISINKPSFDFRNMSWGINIDMKNLGDWSIDVDVSPSVAILEQIERDTIMQLIGTDQSGQVGTLLRPYIAESIKTPKAKEMAARLTYMVPPNILAAEQGKDFSPPSDPTAAIQMQTLQLQLQQLQADIQRTQAETQKIGAESVKAQMEAMNGKLEQVVSMIRAQADNKRADAHLENVKLKQIIEPKKLEADIMIANADLKQEKHRDVAELIKTQMAHHEKILGEINKVM